MTRRPAPRCARALSGRRRVGSSPRFSGIFATAGDLMLTRIAAFATSLALLSSPASPRAAGRPVILIVHGRGMLERDTASLRAHWQRALESGGRGYTRAPLLADDDVRLVWYADALDPRSSAGGDFAPSDPRRASRQGPNAELRGFASAGG